MIQKAGEIIPQVVRVEADARKGTETSFRFPTTCPSCGAPVERTADEVDYLLHQSARRDAPSSSRSGSAGTPTATPWTSTAWARS